MTQQGYITLAIGDRHYYEMACNLALSLKLMDPKRRRCLIHDGNKDTLNLTAYFDDLVELPYHEDYVGCANKLRLYDHSPYEETFFIDSDCLLVKQDMDRHWQKYSSFDFNIAGDKALSGSWYHFDIANIKKRLDIPYVVKMNSGVIYFRKTLKAQSVFQKAISYFENQAEILGYIHQKRKNQYADEPFFGTAMGAFEIEPVTYAPEEGSIMITTYLARNCHADIAAQASLVEKPTGFYLLNRFIAKSYVPHTPTILHFIGLKPKRLYQKLNTDIRTALAI